MGKPEGIAPRGESRLNNTTRRAESSPRAHELHFSIRPEQLEKLPPCQASCPNGGDIRGWLGLIAQHEKLGLSLDTAYRKAWENIVAFNPFPATLGRICPHPCETGCTRGEKDGAVAINAMERFLGDWGLQRNLPLPATAAPAQPETIAVIGAGPAGLSFAYQMRRRGYPVTIYDANPHPGGMLQYGIPDYRLPKSVLAAEIGRILELGVQLKLDTEVGDDVSLDELRSRHNVVFLGLGAQRSRQLDIPGETGPGVWSGIEYLRLRSCGYPLNLGAHVAVVGGGNTAIDAARMARRDGADVTVLYRRTRAEMPAIASEIEDALTEGIRIEFLTLPVAILRDGNAVHAIAVQKMELGEPDGSGRRRPIPIADRTDRLSVNAVIVAISQQFDGHGLAPVPISAGQLATDVDGRLDDDLWAGGDDRGIGIAGLAIAQGRQAAEAVHAELRGLPARAAARAAPVLKSQVKTGFYETRGPVDKPRRPAREWLAEPNREIDQTINSADAQREAGRCLSCGLCFGCEQCWMYCNGGGFFRLAQTGPGMYFSLDTDRCEGCGKCIEVCPSGFLSISRDR